MIGYQFSRGASADLAASGYLGRAPLGRGERRDISLVEPTQRPARPPLTVEGAEPATAHRQAIEQGGSLYSSRAGRPISRTGSRVTSC